MEYRRFDQSIIARIDRGEEILSNLMEICEKENITLATVNAIGAVGKFKIGLFDTELKQYFSKEYIGDYEIASLSGTISTMDGKKYSHIHMSAADKNNTTYGGHLNEAYVSATCEMCIQIIEGNVDREFNKDIGLNLFKF